MQTKYVLLLIVLCVALLNACSRGGSAQEDKLAVTEPTVENSPVAEMLQNLSALEWETGKQIVVTDDKLKVTITSTESDPRVKKLCVGDDYFPMIMMTQDTEFRYYGFLIEATDTGFRISTATRVWDEELQRMSQVTVMESLGEYQTPLPWTGKIEVRGESAGSLWSIIRFHVERC